MEKTKLKTLKKTIKNYEEAHSACINYIANILSIWEHSTGKVEEDAFEITIHATETERFFIKTGDSDIWIENLATQKEEYYRLPFDEISKKDLLSFAECLDVSFDGIIEKLNAYIERVQALSFSLEEEEEKYEKRPS